MTSEPNGTRRGSSSRLSSLKNSVSVTDANIGTALSRSAMLRTWEVSTWRPSAVKCARTALRKPSSSNWPIDASVGMYSSSGYCAARNDASTAAVKTAPLGACASSHFRKVLPSSIHYDSRFAWSCTMVGFAFICRGSSHGELSAVTSYALGHEAARPPSPRIVQPAELAPVEPERRRRRGEKSHRSESPSIFAKSHTKYG